MNLASTYILVQHCVINGEFCTCYFCQYCIVVNQRCHRHRLFPPPCPDKNIRHIIYCYIRNALLVWLHLIKLMFDSSKFPPIALPLIGAEPITLHPFALYTKPYPASSIKPIKELSENNPYILTYVFLRLHRIKSLDAAHRTYIFLTCTL